MKHNLQRECCVCGRVAIAPGPHRNLTTWLRGQGWSRSGYNQSANEYEWECFECKPRVRSVA